MQGIEAKPRRWWLWGAALAACAFIIWGWPLISQIFTQLAIAYVLMAVALPLCRLYERKLSPALSATLALLTLLVGAAALIVIMVPLLWRQIQQLIAIAPVFYDQLLEVVDTIKDWLNQYGVQFEWLDSQQLSKPLQALADATLPTLAEKAGGMVDGLSKVMLAPVLAFYLLKDRDAITRAFCLWVPLKYRARAVTMAREIKREIAGFFRGQLLVCLVVGVMTAIGLLIVGVPAWFLLGILMGVFEIIPYLGPFLAAIPVVIFSLPSGWGKTLWALGVVILVQQLESGMVSPRLMSGATRLHPVIVLLAISAGGLWGGVMGMLLALPVVVSLRGAFRVLRLNSAFGPEK